MTNNPEVNLIYSKDRNIQELERLSVYVPKNRENNKPRETS